MDKIRYDYAMKSFSRLWTYTAALLILTAATPVPAFAQSDIQDYIVLFGGFLSNILLPFLFSLAFLFFLYNIARYFIFGGASEDDRKKAKRAAVYGIAAFVFLVIIWSIVNVLLSGIGLTRNATICNDYFSLFSGPCTSQRGAGGGGGGSIFGGSGTATFGSAGTSGTIPGGATGSTGGSTGSTGGTTGGSTGGATTGTDTTSGSGTSAGTAVAAPLAELIFGTGRDGAGYHVSPTVSGALSSTPTIVEAQTCTAGIDTLMLASRTEPAQAAYLYYRNSAGAMRWQNITDRHTANYIGYDRDVIDGIIAAGGTDLHIIHTHPTSRTRALGLVMTGHGPSTADWEAMCAINNPAITYVTVDDGGVWTSEHTDTTCPYTPAARAQLPTLETYGALAVLEASTRPVELLEYIESSLVPGTQDGRFTAITPSSLTNLTPEQVLAFSNDVQTLATTSVAYFATSADFCATR